jgi:hypothetical protein
VSLGRKTSAQPAAIARSGNVRGCCTRAEGDRRVSPHTLVRASRSRSARRRDARSGVAWSPQEARVSISTTRSCWIRRGPAWSKRWNVAGSHSMTGPVPGTGARLLACASVWCLGCFVTLPTSVQPRPGETDSLGLCESCGRILYWGLIRLPATAPRLLLRGKRITSLSLRPSFDGSRVGMLAPASGVVIGKETG